MAVSAITLFSAGTSRKNLRAIIHKYWLSGTLAIVVCVGISAIQWLPLLELASLSHRQDGVEASIVGSSDFFIRGLLYSTDNVSRPAHEVIAFFPNTGSLSVCVLASLSLLWPSTARIKGHLIASFLLLNLGLGPASPLYDFIATNHLIPGMSSFRIMFPYFIMSIVGTAILAASSLDKLSTIAEPGQAINSWRQWLRWPIFIGFWGFTLYHFHAEAAPNINYMILALGVIGLGGLAAARKLSVIPSLASLLLVMEIVLLRVSPFGTIENSLLTSTPPHVQHILSTADHQQFKHFQHGLAALAFSSPYAEQLHNRTEQELQNIVASNNLLWGVPSFSAALALKHAYKTKVNDVVVSEFTGGSDNKPGYRLMDILSIKWISKGVSGVSSHLVAIRDPGARSLLWENPYAKPLVQTYTLVSRVDDPNQALDSLKGDVSGTLYIQATEKIPEGINPPAVDSGIRLKTNRQSATDYEFQADSESGFWLFMSDTFHPGWKASVDGESTRVFPAQVIGKAIYVPPGQREVRLYFQSDSFRLGALICILTMLPVLIYTAYAWRRRRITASGNGFASSNK